jgi:hypothetical protein
MFRRRNERADQETDREPRTEAEMRDRRAHRRRGLTRGVATLVGAGAAGLLIWLATQTGDQTTGDYWALYGLLAAAGLALALSQLLGGWTKWGWPRISSGVFLLGFVPVLIAGGWILLAHQPSDNWFQETAVNWAGDIGLGGLVDDFEALLPALALGIGLVFGFTFDTTGPRVAEERVAERRAPVTTPAPVEERAAADEPLTAERRTIPATMPDPEAEAEEEPSAPRRWFSRRRTATTPSDRGGTAVQERPATPAAPPTDDDR